MKNIKYTLLSLSLAALIASCTSSHGNDPGWEYAPDMYISKGVEPYRVVEEDADNPYKQMRLPVKGTIARGKMDYATGLAEDSNGYETAKSKLTNPIVLSESVLKDGQVLYLRNCSVCHGEQGNADGSIVTAGKYPPPPAYNSDRIKQLPDGGMFYSITYGKNLMGPYGPMMSPEERWKVIHYIKYLSLNGDPNQPKYNLN